MAVVVRPAELRDVLAISTIAREAWEFTYGGIYPPTFIQRFVQSAYGTESLQRSIQTDLARPHRLFIVAVDRLDQPFAFAQSVPTDVMGEYDLVRIYARPQAHNSGVGRALLRSISSGVADCEVLFAWVERENSIGKTFYERNGFVCTEEKEDCVAGYTTILQKYVWKSYPVKKNEKNA